MAKYQQYEQYKESGVEWLGDIPSYWEINRHKYVASFTKGKNPQEIFDEYSPDYYPYLSMDSLRGNSAHKYAPLAKNLYLVNENQPLIIWDGSNAGEFVRGRRGILSSTMAAAKLNCMMNPNYYWYLCMCIEPEMRKHANGMGIPHVNGDELKNISLVNPSLSEQSKIANFLDHETAQIDTLIEKQQTLIQLLKEKRQAVISHAVTKGLNPDAPMKDSGVEWLGSVPEHWEVKRIKHYGKIMGGFAFKSDDFIDSGYPVLKISNVSHLQLNFDDESFLPLSFVEKHLEYKVEENDLVFAMTRPIISGGIKVAKIPKLEAMPLVNQRVGFLKLKSELLADFILYSSLSSSFKAQFKNNMTITNQPNISGEGIESVALPMPPKNELVEIVDFLNNSETVFQNLSIKSEQQVELLKERRTALISAAVTGKIDVRGWRAADNKAS